MQHYTRKGQEWLLNSLKNECMDSSKVKLLSDYQLMSKINQYLIKLNLVPYTEEELEMELN